jgi:hypothetical protein
MADLNTSGLGDSFLHLLAKATMSHSLECPQDYVSCGPGSHQAEQAALDLTVVHRWTWYQGLTLNTRSHSVLLADLQERKEVTQRPRHLFI